MMLVLNQFLAQLQGCMDASEYELRRRDMAPTMLTIRGTMTEQREVGASEQFLSTSVSQSWQKVVRVAAKCSVGGCLAEL